MDILTQVMKHFKTLLKSLHDAVQSAKDPTVIEHTNRQIRAINTLKAEVRRSMKLSNKRNSKSCGSIELVFSGLSASEFEGRSSINSGKQQA